MVACFNDFQVQVCSRPENLYYANMSAVGAVAIMEFYEIYYNISYPLTKISTLLIYPLRPKLNGHRCVLLEPIHHKSPLVQVKAWCLFGTKP